MARKSRRFVPLAARLCREILPAPVDGAQVDAVAALFRQLNQQTDRQIKARLVMEYQSDSDGSWDYKFFVEEASDHAGNTVDLPLALVELMLGRAVGMAPDMFQVLPGDNAK